MRVGVVLGGGGEVGLAYHAGALAALEHDLGWDPRSADVIVGTSAGSIVGALLRRGVPASDLAALTVGAQPSSSVPPHVVAAARAAEDLPQFDLRAFLRMPRLPSPAVFVSWARRPWRLDPVAALAAFLADGRIDLTSLAAHHASALGHDWPDEELWLCVVRRRDLRRVVLGREVHALLSDAVMASSSVPGYFTPVTTGGETYVDGGVRSPTNADVLKARSDLDLVIVVSPMSGRDLPRFGVGAALRRLASRKLAAEVAMLHARGIPTVVVQPSADLAAFCGVDYMSDKNATEIVGHAFLDTGEWLRSPIVRTLLAGLDARHPPRAVAARR